MATSSNEETKTFKVPRNCTRCRNHRLQIEISGHKRYCNYKNCSCDKCRLTGYRQRDMAMQTALRRAQAQDEARLKFGEVVLESSVISPLINNIYPHVGTSPSSQPISRFCNNSQEMLEVNCQPKDQESTCDGESLKQNFYCKFLIDILLWRPLEFSCTDGKRIQIFKQSNAHLVRTDQITERKARRG